MPHDLGGLSGGRVGDDVRVASAILEKIAHREAAMRPVQDVGASCLDPMPAGHVDDRAQAAARIVELVQVKSHRFQLAKQRIGYIAVLDIPIIRVPAVFGMPCAHSSAPAPTA